MRPSLFFNTNFLHLDCYHFSPPLNNILLKTLCSERLGRFQTNIFLYACIHPNSFQALLLWLQHLYQFQIECFDSINTIDCFIQKSFYPLVYRHLVLKHTEHTKWAKNQWCHKSGIVKKKSSHICPYKQKTECNPLRNKAF